MHLRTGHDPPVVMTLNVSGSVVASWYIWIKEKVEDLVHMLATSRDTWLRERERPHNGSKLLLIEAERQLGYMKSSHYSHVTFVDEENGTYNYDCSGFVGYALSRAVPYALHILRHKNPHRRPYKRLKAGNYYYRFVQFKSEPDKGGWMRIVTPLELHPGDIIVWLKPCDGKATSSGHIMIVAGEPVQNPGRTGEILVQVIDSSKSAHAGDTRTLKQSGLGKGKIGIMTDASGLPTGYYWRGGISSVLHETEMVFARIA